MNLFRLQFVEDASNVVFIAGVGLGKSHLAVALGLRACEERHSVLFASAIDVVNTLAAAQAADRLKQGLNRYIKPRVLVLDLCEVPTYVELAELGTRFSCQIRKANST